MKGTLLIIFKSKHSYVKRYVDIIGNALGCDAVPLDKLKKDMFSYDRYLYIGPISGGVIDGFKKLNDYLDAIADKLVVCGVGMLPRRENTEARLKDSTISVMYEDKIPVFYAQGGFDVNELTRTEKMRISMLVNQIKKSSVIDEDETYVINAVTTPVDEVKTANIKHLIDYLDGRHVDEKLYSPPKKDVAGE